MNAQEFRSSEAPSPSIRHDNVFTSHPCPPQAKSQRKHKQFDHPMSSPSLGNTAHGVGHHRPWAVVAASMGGPRSPSLPPTCNSHKNNIRGNNLSVATCFCELCMCGKGRACGGGVLLACKGGAKSSKQYSPIEHICQILTWQGETSTCPRSHNGP